MSIVCENVSKNYGTQKVLDNINFDVKPGQVTGFLGPNGAGKSTTMKIITGYLPADSGNVSVSGLPVDCENVNFRSKIGYLPEHTPLYLEMYVREYLQVTAGFYGLRKGRERVEEVIELTGLTPESHKKIGALSKGYRQRVGLAQALVHDPEVLILDEPTTGLDPNQLDDIRALVSNICKQKTVLLSTHIMQEVEAICSRVIIINNGHIEADDSTEHIKRLANGAVRQVAVKFVEAVAPDFWSSLPFVSKAVLDNDGNFVVSPSGNDDIRPLLFKAAVANNLTLIMMAERSQSIENVFRQLTHK